MTDLAQASPETLPLPISTREVPFETFSISVPAQPMLLNGEPYTIVVDEDRLKQMLSYKIYLPGKDQHTRLRGLDVGFGREGVTDAQVEPETGETAVDAPYRIPMGFDAETGIIHCRTLEGQQDSTASSKVIAQEVQDKLNIQIIEALLQNTARTMVNRGIYGRRLGLKMIASSMATIVGLESSDETARSLLNGGAAGLGAFTLSVAGIVIFKEINDYRLRSMGVDTRNPMFERAVKLAKSKRSELVYTRSKLSEMLPVITVLPVIEAIID